MNTTAALDYRCTCHTAQYGPAGSFTWNLIGVLCPNCEDAMEIVAADLTEDLDRG